MVLPAVLGRNFVMPGALHVAHTALHKFTGCCNVQAKVCYYGVTTTKGSEMEDPEGFRELANAISKLSSNMDELIANIDSLSFRLGDVLKNLKRSHGQSIEAKNRIVRMPGKTARVTQREYDVLMKVSMSDRSAELERIRKA